MFSAYNGKPVLIRDREGKGKGKGGSGRMRALDFDFEGGPGEEGRRGRALEMSVDIGSWGYVAACTRPAYPLRTVL